MHKDDVLWLQLVNELAGLREVCVGRETDGIHAHAQRELQGSYDLGHFQLSDKLPRAEGCFEVLPLSHAHLNKSFLGHQEAFSMVFSCKSAS